MLSSRFQPQACEAAVWMQSLEHVSDLHSSMVGDDVGAVNGDAVGETVQPVQVNRQLAYHVGSVSQNPSRSAWTHWAGANMSTNAESL